MTTAEKEYIATVGQKTNQVSPEEKAKKYKLLNENINKYVNLEFYVVNGTKVHLKSFQAELVELDEQNDSATFKSCYMGRDDLCLPEVNTFYDEFVLEGISKYIIEQDNEGYINRIVIREG